MEPDSTRTSDSASRPLPQWLVRQKEGLNSYKPEKIVMKNDKSLQNSFIGTGIAILLIISILTLFVLKRGKKLK